MLASPLPASVQLLTGLTAVWAGLLSESTRTACGVTLGRPTAQRKAVPPAWGVVLRSRLAAILKAATLGAL